MAPDSACNVPSEGQPIGEHAIRIVEKLHSVHTHYIRAASLFRLTQRAHFLRTHRVNTGLTTCHQDITYLLTLRRPARDGTGSPVLQVVRMCHYRQDPVPILRQDYQILWLRHGASLMAMDNVPSHRHVRSPTVSW